MKYLLCRLDFNEFYSIFKIREEQASNFGKDEEMDNYGSQEDDDDEDEDDDDEDDDDDDDDDDDGEDDDVPQISHVTICNIWILDEA